MFAMCRHAVLFQSWQTSFRNVWNAHNSLCKWWCEKEESFKMVLEVTREKWIGGGRRSHRAQTSGSKKNVARVQANWHLTIWETTIIWLSLGNPDQRFEQITLYLSVLMGKNHSYFAANCLPSWLVTMWLLSIPQIQRNEREAMT